MTNLQIRVSYGFLQRVLIVSPGCAGVHQQHQVAEGVHQRDEEPHGPATKQG